MIAPRMLAYVVFGATYAFAAAVQPGPFQAYLVSETLTRGWRRTLPASLAPLLSDGPVIVLTLVVLTQVSAGLQSGLRCAGGLFLLYLAVGALRTWQRYTPEPAASLAASARRSVLRAALVNLLNPNPYLGWSLVLGPLLLQGWHETPARGVALVVAFYTTMIVSLAAIISLFAAAGSLGPRVGRALVGVSAVALACFGCYELWSGARALL